MKQYRIGLLGGLGPISTGIFYRLLIDKIQSSGYIRSNLDFPNIIINSIPAPDLTSTEVTELMIQPYIDGLNLLQSLQADLLFMICNSIHVYFDEVKEKSGATNTLSIREGVIEKLKQHRGSKICILGMPCTVNSGLFFDKKLQYLSLNKQELENLGKLVREYNMSGDLKKAQKKLNSLIKKKKAEGANLFLLACTEISAIAQNTSGVLFEDTLKIMADLIVEKFLSWKTGR